MGEVSARALARHSLSINVARFWQVASRLVLTPAVIAAVGLDGYGTWALLFGICGTVMGLDAGLGSTYGKLTAELDQRRDYARLSDVLGSGIALAGAMAGLGFAVIWCARAWVLSVFGVPLAFHSDAERALWLLGGAMLLQGTYGAAVHVLPGLQRMDVRARVEMVGSFVEVATVLLLLRAGLGLVALALGYLAGQVLVSAIALLFCRRLRPAVRFSPWRARVGASRQVVALAVRFQGSTWAGVLSAQLLRLLLSALCGTAALGAFHLADRLLYVAKIPAAGILAPLLPAFANLTAAGDARRWRALFLQASKAVAIAAVVPLSFAALFADALLFAWTGHSYPAAAWTVRILAASDCLRLLTGVATAALRAAGTVRLELALVLLTGASMLAGAAAASAVAGYAGVVVAVAVAGAVTAAWFLQRATAALRFAFVEYATAVVRSAGLALAPMLLIGLAVRSALPIMPSAGATRWSTLFLLLTLAGGAGSACALATWRFVLAPAERDILRRAARLSPG